MRTAHSSGEESDYSTMERASDAKSEPFQLKWLDAFETGNPEIDQVHRN